MRIGSFLSITFIFHSFCYVWRRFSPYQTSLLVALPHMLLHHFDSSLILLFKLRFFHDSYLDSRTSFQSLWFSVPSLHFNFAKKVKLNFLISLIPNPSSFGLYIFYSHLIHVIFLACTPHPQRKFLWIFMIALHIFLGALKNDK